MDRQTPQLVSPIFPGSLTSGQFNGLLVTKGSYWCLLLLEAQKVSRRIENLEVCEDTRRQITEIGLAEIFSASMVSHLVTNRMPILALKT